MHGKSSRSSEYRVWKKSQELKGAYSSSKVTERSRLCHTDGHMSSQAEVEPKLQKYKDRVVLQWWHCKKRPAYTVLRKKKNSGVQAVFTEQGSSASQMTAAQVMDVKARLPDWDGQTIDAVISDIQLNVQDAVKLLKIPKSKDTDTWTRFSRSDIEDPIVPLEGNSYEHPLTWSTFSRISNGRQIIWCEIDKVYSFTDSKNYSHLKHCPKYVDRLSWNKYCALIDTSTFSSFNFHTFKTQLITDIFDKIFLWLYSEKFADCSKFLFRRMDTSSAAQMVQIISKHLRFPWYLLNKIFMVIHQLEC